jgi:hypothetical protein
MAKVHRVMRPDPHNSGVPKVGEAFACLGVRIPKDIQPDAGGQVGPGGKGLSVEPSLEAIGIFMVPTKYAHLLPGAVGNDKYSVWTLRGSSFQNGPIAPKLHLACDSPFHGVIEPDTMMLATEYQTALAATQPDWEQLLHDSP